MYTLLAEDFTRLTKHKGKFLSNMSILISHNEPRSLPFHAPPLSSINIMKASHISRSLVMMMLTKYLSLVCTGLVTDGASVMT